jgi:hypothetical protein
MRNRKYIFLLLVIFSFHLVGCDLGVLGADEKFGRQNFNSAISLIELHKVRYGEYPKSLNDLRFLGDWDQIWLSAVNYERTEEGYDLFLVRGLVDVPELEYPKEFKNGLGIRATNVRWVDQ